jgi:hypothetical protein
MAATFAAAQISTAALERPAALASGLRCGHLAFRSAARGQSLVASRKTELRSQRAVGVQVRAAGYGGDRDGGEGGRGGESENDGFQERVVQIRRVTKVVKGGKQLSFRAVVSWWR